MVQWGHKTKTINHPRHGTQCVMEYQQTEGQHNLQENALTVCLCCRLNNSLPKYLSYFENVKTEKFNFNSNL